MRKDLLIRTTAMATLCLVMASSCSSAIPPSAYDGISGKYAHVRLSTESYGYNFSYRETTLKITQSVANKLEIQGKTTITPDNGWMIVSFGNESYTLYVDPDGNIPYQKFILELDDAALFDNELPFRLSYDIAGEVYNSDESLFVDAITYDAKTGEIGYPAGTYYISKSGEKKLLISSMIPSDIAISEKMLVEFVCESGTVVASITGRLPADAPDKNTSAGQVFDLTDEKITVDAVAGLEYTLDGTTWIKADGDKVTFAGLAPDTQYTLSVRTPESNEALASDKTDIGTVSTLTSEEAKAKADFEDVYSELEAEIGTKILDDEDAARLSEAFDALTDRVKELPSVKDKADKTALALDFENAKAEIKKEIEDYRDSLSLPADVSDKSQNIIDKAFEKIDSAATVDEAIKARDDAKAGYDLLKEYSKTVAALPEDQLKDKIVEKLDDVYEEQSEKIGTDSYDPDAAADALSAVEEKVIKDDFLARNEENMKSDDPETLKKVLDEIASYPENRQQMLSEYEESVSDKLEKLVSDSASDSKKAILEFLKGGGDGKYITELRKKYTDEINAFKLDPAEIAKDPSILDAFEKRADEIKADFGKAITFEETIRKPYAAKADKLKTDLGGDNLMPSAVQAIEKAKADIESAPHTKTEAEIKAILDAAEKSAKEIGVKSISSSDGKVTLTHTSGIPFGYTVEYTVKDTDDRTFAGYDGFTAQKYYVITLKDADGKAVTSVPGGDTFGITIKGEFYTDLELTALFGTDKLEGTITSDTVSVTSKIGEIALIYRMPVIDPEPPINSDPIEVPNPSEEDEVNLLWVAILLGVIFACETVGNFAYAGKRKKAKAEAENAENSDDDENAENGEQAENGTEDSQNDTGKAEKDGDQGEKMYSFNPMMFLPLILTVYTPAGIIPVIGVLGALTVISGAALVAQVAVAHKKQKAAEEAEDASEEEKSEELENTENDTAENVTDETESKSDEVAEDTEEAAAEKEKAEEPEDSFKEDEKIEEPEEEKEEVHKYISPDSIILSEFEEEEDRQDEESYDKPIIALTEGEEEPEETAVEDENLDDDEDSEKKVYSDHGLKIIVTYNYSFEAKLRMSKASTRHMYSVLSEYLLSYKLGKRRSWKNERYYLKGKTYSRMMFRGKTLCVCLAIDPKSLEGSKYRCEDMSGVKKYAAVPTMMRLKTGRAFKHTLELIQMMMASAGIEQAYIPEDNFVPTEPEHRQPLIEEGLIKVLATDDAGEVLGHEEEITSGKIDLSSGGMPLMEDVTAEEAHKISDKTAESFVNIEEETVLSDDEAETVEARRKGIVNIDSISAAYENGETVTLASLKEKGLVAKNVTSIKILARGHLNKSLTVKAHDFSLDAVKMIIIAGGNTVKLKKVKVADK